MAFDFSNGLSAAGAAVSKTAGDYLLESQKADLEQAKIMLADQLAGAREEKGRQFTTSEREATQTFQGGENEKTRQNTKEVADIQGKYHVQAAGIGAGATVQAAIINAKAHAADIDKQLEATRPQREADTESKKIQNSVQTQILDARTDYLTALDKGDVDAATKAIQRMAGIEFNPKDQYTEASLYQSQARLYEQAYTAAQTKLATLSANPMTSMSDQGKATIASLQKQVDMLQNQFIASTRAAQEALNRVPNYGGRSTAPSGGTPGVIQYDAQGNRISTPGAAAAPPSGMINTPGSRY